MTQKDGALIALIGIGLFVMIYGMFYFFLRGPELLQSLQSLCPKLVGQDARLPDIVVLVSILGGIASFGPIGIILGPVIAAMPDTILEIYRRLFRDQLPS